MLNLVTYQKDTINQHNLSVKTPSTNLAADTTTKDTVYGIVNEDAIPFRNVEVKDIPTTKTEIEILFNPTKKEVDVYSWQTMLLILGIFVVGFAKAFSNNRFKQSLKSLFNYSVAQEITREEKVFFHRANLLLTINHIICVSLFIFYLNDIIHFSYNRSPIVAFLFIPVFILGAYTLKYIFSKILFFIFNDVSLSNEYIFNVSIYNHLLGVFLIPILGLCYFSGLSTPFILTYFAIPSISISLIMRVFRLVVVGKSKGVSYFYIFLYICTLEILPLVALYRFFILK